MAADTWPLQSAAYLSALARRMRVNVISQEATSVHAQEGLTVMQQMQRGWIW